MDKERIQSSFKSLNFINRFLLWSRAERMHGPLGVEDHVLIEQINFALICIEFLFQQVPELDVGSEAAVELSLLVKHRGIEGAWETPIETAVLEAVKRGREFYKSQNG